MHRFSQFLDDKLPRTIRTSLIILASIVGVWAVWIFFMLISLVIGVFVAVGNGDGPMPDGAFPDTPLSRAVDMLIGGAPAAYMFMGLFLVCGMNLLYLCRYWDKLPIRKKVISGFLFCVTSLPFLLIVFGLLMRLFM